MRALTLMYHDVVEPGALDSSGFPGRSAAAYKLDRQEFERHLAAIRDSADRPPVELVTAPRKQEPAVFLTFDDGGVSAHRHIADLLEPQGWSGHFFVPTDRIGTAGFLSAAQIRDLRQRGHLIGSHSASHPARMGFCTREQLLREWRESVQTLEQILGEPVTTAASPSGYYSRMVAVAAAEAGIQILFNSEPTMQTQVVDGCLLLGRYCVRRGMGPGVSAALAAGRPVPRWRQSLLWAIKKTVKKLVVPRSH